MVHDEFTEHHAEWIKKELRQDIEFLKYKHKDKRSLARVQAAKDRAVRGLELIGADIEKGKQMIEDCINVDKDLMLAIYECALKNDIKDINADHERWVWTQEIRQRIEEKRQRDNP